MLKKFRVTTRKVLGSVAVLAFSLALVGCGETPSGGGSDSPSETASDAGDNGVIKVATIDKLYSLDPAGSYDNGSFQVQIQVFPMLFNYDHESKSIAPDLAESGEYTAPDEYTVKLKADAKWSDGSPITSEDVKFSYDRVIKINDESGPASLLGNIVETTAPDATTVVFKLANQNDQVFPSILGSPAGVIVPKATFKEDAITDPDTIVAGGVFGGQYTLKTFKMNEFIEFEANPNYTGVWGTPKTAQIQLQYLADASNLRLSIENGDVDVAFRTLTPTDIADLRNNPDVKVVQGPGGEERYIVFNLELQPFGEKTSTPDSNKALAVRQAAAHLIDRVQIADSVYKNTYTPVYSPVTDGLLGATAPYKELYGDGQGGPDFAKAKKVLEDAEIEYPVELQLQYNPDHYGASSADEYALIKNQLEAEVDGAKLFSVELQGTEWVTYNKARLDSYPAYQLGWYPDYPDADNYVSPFFGPNNFLHSGYANEEVNKLIINQQTEADSTKRADFLTQIQDIVAKDVPTLPLLQGDQIAVVRANVSGADQTLDPSFKFTYGYLSKS
ncbi:MAG: ABC transporter substrate-binding protein [Bifidobacteriaceae bacterium]|jgi:peptide/nickel transport system substrate-binding protein|nr:ABC transporter substrate-binding protein [Bifidobacteriaceae bacterium]